jgi:hypothetical protein
MITLGAMDTPPEFTRGDDTVFLTTDADLPQQRSRRRSG